MIAEDGNEVQTEGIVWMENGSLIVNSKAERRTFTNVVLINMSADRSVEVQGVQVAPSGTGELPKLFRILISMQ